jgi:hypothetical protein
MIMTVGGVRIEASSRTAHAGTQNYDEPFED